MDQNCLVISVYTEGLFQHVSDPKLWSERNVNPEDSHEEREKPDVSVWAFVKDMYQEAYDS